MFMRNKWSGPVKIIGEDGTVMHFKYENNVKRVHKSKLVKVAFEFHKEVTPENDENKKKNGTFKKV